MDDITAKRRERSLRRRRHGRHDGGSSRANNTSRGDSRGVMISSQGSVPRAMADSMTARPAVPMADCRGHVSVIYLVHSGRCRWEFSMTSRLFAYRLMFCSILLLVAIPGFTDAGEPERGWPNVCRNPELLRAIAVIESACRTSGCDVSKLTQLDTLNKPTLLLALRNPNLMPVHLFFPNNKSDVRDTFDWYTTKRDQLATLKYTSDPSNAIIFVIAHTSRSGSRERNYALSRDRVTSVVKYLQNNLGVRSRSFRAAWLGEDVFNLSETDARLLEIEPRDYRRDDRILNQSVHIFVYPCADLLHGD